MLGAALGGITGGIQLYLLILVAASVEQCNIKIWPLVVQFFCPIVGLGLVRHTVAQPNLILRHWDVRGAPGGSPGEVYWCA